MKSVNNAVNHELDGRKTGSNGGLCFVGKIAVKPLIENGGLPDSCLTKDNQLNWGIRSRHGHWISGRRRGSLIGDWRMILNEELDF
jgi:hypothetical protein